jgi:hypothetical protein
MLRDDGTFYATVDGVLYITVYGGVNKYSIHLFFLFSKGVIKALPQSNFIEEKRHVHEAYETHRRKDAFSGR